MGNTLHSPRIRTTRTDPGLPDLATYLYHDQLRETGSSLRVVTTNVDYVGDMYKSYVRIEKPGTKPESFSDGYAAYSTRGESLEALLDALVCMVAASGAAKIREYEADLERLTDALKVFKMLSTKTGIRIVLLPGICQTFTGSRVGDRTFYCQR